MEEFKISVFIAIFEEMFGFFLWWSLVIIGVVIAVLFFYFLIKEKRTSMVDFRLASIAAPIGAIIAVFVVFWLTVSGFSDLRGTVDYILISIIAFSAALAAFVCVYVAQSISAKLQS